MNQAYMNIAELLKIHSNICGIYRESWFLDPNLKDISPERELFVGGSTTKWRDTILHWKPPQSRKQSRCYVATQEKTI